MRIFMQKMCFLSLMIFSFSALAVDSKVTLPLAEYTRLQDAVESPDVTVVETVEISGEYGKVLKLRISGATAGKPVLTDFLELPRGSIYDCKGSALVKKSGDSWQILGQANRFVLDCSMNFLQWSEAHLTLLNAHHSSIRITGGESIISGDSSNQSVSLTRISTAVENDKAEVSVVGHHRITVYPEEAKFEYNLQLSHPGKSKKIFSFPLRNGELVQSVFAQGEYKDSESSVDFTLSPGMNNVSLKGRFKGTNFQVPLPSAQNFLLMENSPMIQLTVDTKARRISVQDTGMNSQFSTSRAYLLSGNERATWTAKQLEVFASTGYSINQANYTVYVPWKGSSIVEMDLEVNNQGTPEIPLKVKGRVTYVEVAGAPQVLLKDPGGSLLLQVPSGIQRVLVQYEGESGGNFMGRTLQMPLVRPATVMSDVSLKVRLAPRFDLLAGKGLFDFRTDVHVSRILWALIYTLFVLVILKKLTFSSVHRMGMIVSSFLVFVFLPTTGPIFVILFGLIVLYRHRKQLMVHWPKKSWVQIGVVAIGACIAVLAMNLFDRAGDQMMDSKIASMNLAETAYHDQAPAAAPMMMKGRSGGAELVGHMDSSIGFGGGGVSSPVEVQGDYKGLPARLKIPNEGRVLVFHQGMLDLEAGPEVKLIMVDAGMRAILLAVGVIGVVYLFWANRRQLKDYLIQ
jgi:hypothetical protein